MSSTCLNYLFSYDLGLLSGPSQGSHHLASAAAVAGGTHHTRNRHSCHRGPHQAELLLVPGCSADVIGSASPDCLCHDNTAAVVIHASRSGSPRSGGSPSPHRSASPSGGVSDELGCCIRSPAAQSPWPLIPPGGRVSPGVYSDAPPCCTDYEDR